MAQAFSDGLLIPAIVLALIGWLVPRALSMRWPEGVRPLILLAVVSTGILFSLSVGFFVTLYLWQGAPFASLWEAGVWNGIVHFVRLGLISALLWGPIMILSVSGLPRHWVKETW